MQGVEKLDRPRKQKSPSSHAHSRLEADLRPSVLVMQDKRRALARLSCSARLYGTGC
jgi:hypothetical protein